MKFRKREKRRLEPLKSNLFSAEVSEPGRYMGNRRDFCLLQFLQPFQLIRLHSALVLAPAVERHFADVCREHLSLIDCSESGGTRHIRNRHTLATQNISLPELRNDLFGLVASLYHLGPPINGILIQQRSVIVQELQSDPPLVIRVGKRGGISLVRTESELRERQKHFTTNRAARAKKHGDSGVA